MGAVRSFGARRIAIPAHAMTAQFRPGQAMRFEDVIIGNARRRAANDAGLRPGADCREHGSDENFPRTKLRFGHVEHDRLAAIGKDPFHVFPPDEVEIRSRELRVESTGFVLSTLHSLLSTLYSLLSAL